MRHRHALLAVVFTGALVGAACGSSSSSTAATTTTTPGTNATTTSTTPIPKISGEVTVFAAASLTDAFTEMGKALEAGNPGASVVFSFGGSSTLVAQIQQGAPADSFASADQPNMKKLTDAGLQAADPKNFARNKLEIIVPKDNPKGITSLADLAKPDVILALCAPAVPCGNFAQQALQKAGVTVKPASLEDNVKGVVSKAQLGEIDAGIAYVTDVLAGGNKVKGVPIPDDVNPIAVYPIAPVKAAKNLAGAQAFEAYVLSPAGQAVLGKYGFLAP
jgi:molybdate transport system substrate-binding protein